MTPIFDPSTNFPITRPNVSVTVPDVSGIDSLTGTDPRLFDTRFPPYFRKIIKGIQSQGCVVGETLFGAPYDWRYGLAQPELFWSDLKALCEKAAQRANEKVVFLTHSFGGHLIHNLLSNRTIHEWRRQFVHSVIFSAPRSQAVARR
jgi:lysophospholipase-3